VTLDEGLLLHLLFVAITYGKVSLWLWKTRGIFSPTLYGAILSYESSSVTEIC